jgi:ABC-type multidrug transport system ATPase subunit
MSCSPKWFVQHLPGPIQTNSSLWSWPKGRDSCRSGGSAHTAKEPNRSNAEPVTAFNIEMRRLIGQLSKDYRQRVGLADALVHEPELIILDEPTIGLDPPQIRAVRQLIKSLANTHTVLISTHILPEAEVTCNRIMIMHAGRILEADTPENLQRLVR